PGELRQIREARRCRRALGRSRGAHRGGVNCRCSERRVRPPSFWLKHFTAAHSVLPSPLWGGSARSAGVGAVQRPADGPPPPTPPHKGEGSRPSSQLPLILTSHGRHYPCVGLSRLKRSFCSSPRDP